MTSNRSPLLNTVTTRCLVLAGLCSLGAAGCGGPSRGEDGGAGGGAGAGAGAGNGSGGEGTGPIIRPSDPIGAGGETNRPVAVIETTLPAGFTPALEEAHPDGMGGWKVVGRLADFDEPADNVCANVLRAVARDFTEAHVDFGQRKPESWEPDGTQGLYVGLVQADLGSDHKPVINPARTPADVIEHFDDWYVNTESSNVPFVMDLWLEPKPGEPDTFVFDSNSFFPLDEHNDAEELHYGGNDNGPHNFLFTIELHTAFEYKGGETFNFRGDDDVWVFINGKLAVDIGGIHGPIERNVDLDLSAGELGLEIGEVYALDLFQAERNPTGSNFRIETSLDFRECGILQDDIIR